MLAKEIAYQWAKNELLTSKKLLLLVFLRECHQVQLKSVENLVQFVFKNTKMIPCLTNHLLHTMGSDTVIVLDGYDELSAKLKEKSIIMDIISRRILTKCCLVVTSRPTASSSLHGSVDRRVEIVGFTEQDRLDYIQSAFKNCDKQVKVLQQYLQSNPTINALCYIPLNMTILLCLTENGINTLPKTHTEMYKNFAQMTIVRFIKKKENCSTIISIADLPNPHDKVFVELANLAFEALKTDKIVFTISEVKKGCPNLTVNPNSWNGLGLLKAVQYFSPQMGSDQVTFHFLHFSVQEYMAAWYISTLSDNDQIKLMNKTFWEHRYYNTWIMYVGITGGNSFALRHFLSGNWFQFYSKLFEPLKVSNKYLKHKMRCLHLFQCLLEAGKEGSIRSVKQLFQNNQIDLSNQTLLPSDLNTLGFFLIRSINKEWDKLDLSNCNIGINGSNILCDRLLDKDIRSIVTVKMVNFSHNQLNFSSVIRLFGLFKSWHTSEIIITDDTMLDNKTDEQAIEDIVLQSSTLTLVFIGGCLFSKSLRLKNILLNTTNIRSLYILNCNWKDSDLIILKLLERQKLNKVRIIGQFADTTVIQRIVSMMISKNDSVNMLVYDPTMTDEVSDGISRQILNHYKNVLGLMLIVSGSKTQGFINTYTLSNGLSALELCNNLNKYVSLKTKMCPWKQAIENNTVNVTINTFVETLLSNNNWQLKVSLLEQDSIIIHKTNYFKLVKTVKALSNVKLQNIVTLTKLCIFRSSITNKIADNIAAVISCNIHLQELNIGNNTFQTSAILKFSRSLQNISSLKKLYINQNNITFEAVDDIAAGISCNQKLQEFDISGNNLQPAGAIKVLKALNGISTLRKLDISYNNITDEAADIVAAVISCNIGMKLLNISGNKLQSAGTIKVLNALNGISTLAKLDISNNNISDEVADDVAAVISCNTDMKVFDISGNSLQAMDAMKIGKILQNICTPKTLFINNDNDAAVDVATITSCLQEVYICSNNFYSTNYRIFTETLQGIGTLSKVHIAFNNISNEAANDIATVLSCNTKLKEVEICGNKVQTSGAIKIMKGLQEINSLKYLYLNNNNITEAAANDIATVLSRNSDLRELHLGDNNLETLGIIKIARSLQKISSITKLCINHNNITDEAADDIAAVISYNKKLQKFNISKNFLQPAGVMKVIKALKSISTLQKLYLSNNNITDEVADYIVAAMSCNNGLKVLDISGNNLKAMGALKIANVLQNVYTPKISFITNIAAFGVAAGISCIQEAYIFGNRLSIADARIFMKDIHTLSKLHIAHNNITDEVANGIVTIVCNTKLKEIEISKNVVQTSAVIKIVKSLQEIENIYLDNNNIGEEAADDIAIALCFNSNLQELHLGGNNLQTSGAIKITKSLHAISSLTKLCIDHNNITDEAADDIAAAISCNTNLKEIDVSGNDLQTSGAIKIAKSLQKISSLTKFCINHNNITHEAAKDIAAVISSNINLKEIDISGNNLQLIGVTNILKTLLSICTLKRLNISDTNISARVENDITIADIVGIDLYSTQLEEINMSGNHLQTTNWEIVMQGLSKFHMLKKLYLSNSDITDVEAEYIVAVVSCIPNLQEIDLSENNIQTLGAIKILQKLQKISSLTKLCINHNNITDEAADDIAAAISCNIHLKELNLGGNDLQTSGVIKIARGLQKISLLTKLCMNYSNITHEAADDIAAAISCNMDLQELNLGDNMLQSSGIIKIARSLQKVSSLTKLYINHNNITYEAANDIAAVISCNIYLQEIILGGNIFQTSGIISVTRNLQNISSLTKLFINDNDITHEAADSIAIAISSNVFLKELHLSENELQTSGIIKIAKSLQKISSLTKLYIDHNNISHEAAGDIAAAISCNFHLEEINLGHNNLQTSGIIKIAKSLHKLSSLIKLYFNHNNITDNAVDDIRILLNNNNRLEIFNIGGNCFSKESCLKIIQFYSGRTII